MRDQDLGNAFRAPRLRPEPVTAPLNVVGTHTSGFGRAVVLGSFAPLLCRAGKSLHEWCFPELSEEFATP